MSNTDKPGVGDAGGLRPIGIVRDDVQAMAAYAVPPADGFVKLDAMENPHRLTPALRDALAARLAQVPINRYPAPAYIALKAAIAGTLGVPPGASLLLGNGSDELISLLCIATARPGACILSPWPSFVMYDVSARLAGSRFVGVPLKADFSLDLPAMLAAIERERPAVVFLAYPNNPTGNCFDDDAIEAILRAAPGLVVVDEAYQPFAQRSVMARLAQHEHLLVLRTVSKLGLAGLRLGYLAGAPRWLAQLDKVRPPYNINLLTEAATLFALEHVDLLNRQAASLRAARAQLLAQLRAIAGLQVFDSQANFVLFRVGGAYPDGATVCQRLGEMKVLVKDVGRMHSLLADCLRVTVGTDDEIAMFLQALRASLQPAGR